MRGIARQHEPSKDFYFMATIKKDYGTHQRKPELNTLLFGKIPPQSIELEEAVIGACMLERDAFDKVMAIIKTADAFYKDAHQKIYAAMQRLITKGDVIDLLTITEELSKTSELELIGGAYYLTNLTMAVNTSAHVENHARIVLEKFMQRELIRISGTIISDAYEGSADVFDLLDRLEADRKAIIDNIPAGNTAVPVGETYSEILMDIEERKNNPDTLLGIDTGYQEINDAIFGWQSGELIILAARPAMGKTAFALNLALNAACSKVNNSDVLIYSLEATNKELVKRMAACKNDVYYSAIRKGELSEFQERKMIEGYKDFNNMRIRIDDKTQKLNHIINSIRIHKKKNPNLKLVMVDYLQLIEVERQYGGNREQDVSTITRSLKLLAKELDIAILALSQLNRQVEARTNKKPQLADLRESGAIEQDANLVMMLWHEVTANRDDKGNDIVNTHVLFVKCRDTSPFDVHIPFAGDIQRWGNLSPQNEPFRPFAGFGDNRDAINRYDPKDWENE